MLKWVRAHPLWTLCGTAILLASTSLGAGQAMDDWLIALCVEGRASEIGLSRSPLDAFSFHLGSPAENRVLEDRGVLLPWWSDPELRVAFFRPVSALTHWVDQKLWPTEPWLMHLHSLVWFGLLLLAVARVYRRLSGSTRLSVFATALYAFDDAHGATLSWIANRNALIAGTLGSCTLWLHDLGRREQKPWAVALALSCFAVALGAGELSVGVLGYLLAHTLLVEVAPLRQRWLACAPYLALTCGWRLCWSYGGYGVRGSGAYVDPLTDPGTFLARAPTKWLLLLGGQFGIVPADLAFLGPTSLRPTLLIVAAVTLSTVAALIRPCFNDRLSRFWLLGMLLSLLPMAATFESDRSLLLVGWGASQLLARGLLDAHAQFTQAALSWSRGAAAAILGSVHCVLAPSLLPLRSAQIGLVSRQEEQAAERIFTAGELTSRFVILLNAPSPLVPVYLQLRRIQQHLPAPRGVLVLAAAPGRIEVTRCAPDQLRVVAEHGFGSTPLERHYRARPQTLAPGSQVRLSPFHAQVEDALPDGRPRSVRFDFQESVQDYLFFCWTGTAFERCQPPALGTRRNLVSSEWTDVLDHAAQLPQARVGQDQR